MSENYAVPHPDGKSILVIAVPTDGADGWGRHGEAHQRMILDQHAEIERLKTALRTVADVANPSYDAAEE